MVTRDEVYAAHRKLEEAIDELVRVATEYDGQDETTVSGYVLSLDNRFIDDEGKIDGYVSYFEPMAGQPDHISRMILRDALEISEVKQMVLPDVDDD